MATLRIVLAGGSGQIGTALARLGEAIASSSRPPTIWMASSTATIYRHALDRPMDEHTGDIGEGFSPFRYPPRSPAQRHDHDAAATTIWTAPPTWPHPTH